MRSGKVHPVKVNASEVEEVWANLCGGATEARFDADAFNTALLRCGCELSMEEQSTCLAELSLEFGDCISRNRFAELLRVCGVQVRCCSAFGKSVKVGAEPPTTLAADGVATRMVDAGAAQVHALWLDLCEGQDVTRLSQGTFNMVLQVLGCQVSREEQERLLRSVPSFTEKAVDEQDRKSVV